MKHIGARHDENVKMLKRHTWERSKIYSGYFGRASHQYFQYNLMLKLRLSFGIGLGMGAEHIDIT